MKCRFHLYMFVSSLLGATGTVCLSIPVAAGESRNLNETLVSPLKENHRDSVGNGNRKESESNPDEKDHLLETDSIEEATLLDEFVIERKMKLVQNDGAKLSYNVTEDPEAGNSSILDILRKVPGVTVDAEENVKVNGQSNFKILRNGLDDPMMKGDLKTVLKSIPASTIIKIEVISEPGAKYSAEGLGGILNIITDRKQNLSGFMTNFSAWINAYGVGGNADGRVKIRKVMLEGGAVYDSGKTWPRTHYHDIIIRNLSGEGYSKQESFNRENSRWDYGQGNITLSWEPDTLNLFNVGLIYGRNTWNTIADRNMTRYDDRMQEIWHIIRNSESPGSYDGAAVTASYQHSFDRPDHNLVVSWQTDYDWQEYTNLYLIETIIGDSGEAPYSRIANKGSNVSHIFQLDYSNQFSPKHLLEAGLKGNVNRNSNYTRQFQGPTPEEDKEDITAAVKLTQLKDIYALYGSYTGSFGLLNIKGGLRYEFTRMGSRYRISDHPDFTTILHDLVPNLAVSYNLGSASNLRLAYQMRIARPSIAEIDPFVNTATPGYLTYGNPGLKSQKSHAVSLAYSNYAHALSGSAKLTYRYTSNPISSVIFMKDDLLHFTQDNTGYIHNPVLDLNIDWSIFGDLRWSNFLSLQYFYMSADSELLKAKSCGWNFFVNSNVDYSLPRKYHLSAYGGVMSPSRSLQRQENYYFYFYGLGLSKTMLKDDALKVSLSLSNLLPSSRRITSETFAPGAEYLGTYRFSNWNVGLSVAFRFGALTSNMKRTASSIEKESGGGPRTSSGN